MTQSRYTVAEVAALLKRPGGKVRNVAPRSDRTYAGVVYDSKAEALFAFELDRQKQLGITWDWKRQIPFEISIGNHLICKIKVDFAVQDEEDGPWRYIELKGWETEVYKLKRKLLLAVYPGLQYIVVKV